MKRVLFGLIMFVGLGVMMSACGKSDSGTNNQPAGTCQAGYVYSQYGCLPQGNCQMGMAMYNNQCMAVQSNYGYGNQLGTQQCQMGSLFSPQYGCLPQGSCQMGMAMYGNQCVQAMMTNTNSMYPNQQQYYPNQQQYQPGVVPYYGQQQQMYYPQYYGNQYGWPSYHNQSPGAYFYLRF